MSKSANAPIWGIHAGSTGGRGRRARRLPDLNRPSESTKSGPRYQRIRSKRPLRGRSALGDHCRPSGFQVCPPMPRWQGTT